MADNARLRKLAPWLLSALGGVLGFLGYVGFDQFYLQWIFLVPMLWASRDATPKRAFFIWWFGGSVAHAGGFYWVTHMLHDFAYLPWAVSAVGMLLMAAVNALSFAVFGWALACFRRSTAWSELWIAPVLWVAVENVYPFIFPNTIGASQYLLPVVTQIADVTGVPGVTYMLVWTNVLLFVLLRVRVEKQAFLWRPAAVYLTALVLMIGYGAYRLQDIGQDMEQAEKLRVGVVQTNLGGAAKHLDRLGFIRRHHEMSQSLESKHKVDLIVWPEGAYNAYLPYHTTLVPQRVLGTISTPALIGTLTVEESEGHKKKHNSALLIDAQKRVLGIYSKRILVPFGEYIPFGDVFPFIYKWSPYSGRYWPGTSLEPLPFGKYMLSVNICYEDLFAGLVRDLMLGDGSVKRTGIPHVMFNLTNDSWYGDTTEPMEHLVLASFRTIEHRRALVRSTNTGISAIIDPTGRFPVRSGQRTQEVLVADVPMMTGQTVFSYLGNWFGRVCTLIAFFGLGQAFWNRKRKKKA